MKTGIICALEVEVNNILTECASVQEQKIAGTVCYTATRIGAAEELEVVLMLCGMGLANAAAGTQLLISHFGVNAVIFSGIAGSLVPEIGINSVVVGKELKYIDAEVALIAESEPHAEVFRAGEELLTLALKTAENLGIELQPVVIVSGNRFISSPDDVKFMRDELGAHAVEMEGAAVAHICMKNGIPSLIIRAISDNCDTSYADFSNQKFSIHASAEKSADFVVKLCEQVVHAGLYLH
ncbi:MAG: 5'-methylthioadenosine/S-adenosylhomocysteine nucleosidase [Candidatus Ancillula trichonymphae]|nr:5'-methylthioadenosine/S-adenosylhomocysteine nucleosidase [Candidatus Ancillula trichonymphae]